MPQSIKRGLLFKLVMLWIVILFTGTLFLSVRSAADMLNMTVLPEAPRQGEPVTATFKLNNPSSEVLNTKYQLYANGNLLTEGDATLAPRTSQAYQYINSNILLTGEQINFTVLAQSHLGNYRKTVSTPPSSPQIWSSFVSIAAYSTSVINYMNGFGDNPGFNIGIIVSLTLIALLLMLELLIIRNQGKTGQVLSRLRTKLSAVSWILLIIFIGMLFTRIVMMATI